MIVADARPHALAAGAQHPHAAPAPSVPALQFTPATKQGEHLRAALFGPSGAGKTYSALAIASGLIAPGQRLALIDTEHGSASKYADRFAFDTLRLQPASIDHYRAAIDAAATAGYPVLIIDSLTHAWQELLEEIDRLTLSSRHKGNKWSAWSEGTPKQKALIGAMLSYPGHLLATMRSKTEWALEPGASKSKPVRIGLAPEQGKGVEYEFDLLLELNQAHAAECIKDRTGQFQDRTIDRPGAAFGAELAAWLAADAPSPAHPSQPRPTDPRGVQCPNPRRADAPTSVPSGAPQSVRHPEAPDFPAPAEQPAPAEATERLSAAQQRRLQEQIRTHAIDPQRVRAWCQRAFGCADPDQLSATQAERLMARLTQVAAEAGSRCADEATDPRHEASPDQSQTPGPPSDSDQHADSQADQYVLPAVDPACDQSSHPPRGSAGEAPLLEASPDQDHRNSLAARPRPGPSRLPGAEHAA